MTTEELIKMIDGMEITLLLKNIPVPAEVLIEMTDSFQLIREGYETAKGEMKEMLLSK